MPWLQVDSLCSARGDNESEAARRIKTQLMVEMQVRASASASAAGMRAGRQARAWVCGVARPGAAPCSVIGNKWS